MCYVKKASSPKGEEAFLFQSCRHARGGEPRSGGAQPPDGPPGRHRGSREAGGRTAHLDPAGARLGGAAIVVRRRTEATGSAHATARLWGAKPRPCPQDRQARPNPSGRESGPHSVRALGWLACPSDRGPQGNEVPAVATPIGGGREGKGSRVRRGDSREGLSAPARR